jgi:CTP:molybdopterin cytidylyltransferase MocA
MTTLIILAGGEGTRLGMLAQPNKALVSVQQRPMYAHHIAAAVEAGIRDIIVVDDGSQRLFARSIRQATPTNVNVTFVKQVGRGPAAATSTGLRASWSTSSSTDEHNIVIMADTLIDHDELVRLFKTGGTWAGMSQAPTYDRSWCWYDGTFTGEWVDSQPRAGVDVFIGLLSLDGKIYLDGGDMAPLLNTVYPSLATVYTWQDVGDLDALSRVKRKTFTARDHHDVNLTNDGWIAKNSSRDERATMTMLRGLVPGSVPGSGLKVEYWPAPSIAELWMYDVLPVAAWQRIAQEVRAFIERIHAIRPTPAEAELVESSTQDMLLRKPIVRQGDAWGEEHDRALHLMAPLLPNRNDKANTRLIHGDPNFTNLLIDPSTMVMRSIDPRGRWGKMRTSYGNRLYDIAKIRYSYVDSFTHVVHNLFDLDGDDVVLPPVDQAKVRAFDEVITDGFNTRVLDAIQASILLSAAPLHNARQARALTLLGLKRAESLA